MPKDIHLATKLSTHRVTGKEGLIVDHLRKDAANGPYVHRRRVRFAAQEDLRRAVPERHHLHQ